MPETQSKLTLRGKACTIMIDADAGGIWIGGDDTNSICLYLNPQGTPYVGIYGPERKPYCAASLGVSRDGEAVLQTGSEEGVKHINLARLQELAESLREPTAPV